MPGVNLSQPVEEEESVESRSFFDTGLMLSVGILLLVGLIFGGIRLYIGFLDKKIAALEETLSVNTARLKGSHIDRIADFDSRLNYFSANKERLSDTKDVLQKLEAHVTADTVLKTFEYNQEDKMVTIEGVSSDFRQLAEQIMVFKNEKIFSQVEVQGMDRTEDNLILFTLKMSL